MYFEDDTMTPRDRISEDMLRRMLDGEKNSGGCGCDGSWSHGTRMNNPPANTARNSWGLRDHPLASVYAPLQEFRGLYDKDTALLKGTAFSELDLPFMGVSIANRGGACK